jgi:hypothetical protein
MNSAMFIRAFLLVPVLLMTSLSVANSPKSKNANAEQKSPEASLPNLQKFADSVNGSYYHPDLLPGLQCTVAVDWSDLFNSAKVKVPQERMHAIDGAQIQFKTLRNKPPEFTFSWLNGPPDTRDQLEGGIRQMVGGFYQSYWSLVASPPIPKASEISRVEPQPDGTTKIYESDPNNKVVIDLDQHDTPTHYAFDTPAFKGTIDIKYADSSTPVPGDLRRISSFHVMANVGASSFNVGVDLDYQQVEGYFVPRRVTYNLVGAYSVSMEFVGCSTISTPLAAKPQE